MQTQNLGFPRIGAHRELKRACENYWAGKITHDELMNAAQNLRHQHWKMQAKAQIDLIPSNDFSLYDQVLDATLTYGAIPKRYETLKGATPEEVTQLYFAMARGLQAGDVDVTAMEMTKWFDTNYHYIVPEFEPDQLFDPACNKPLEEFLEAKTLGIHTKPVLLGPLSYLLLGKAKKVNFDPLTLIDRLLPVFQNLVNQLTENDATWIQVDEPCLVYELSPEVTALYQRVYTHITQKCPGAKLLLTTYFDGINAPEVLNKLPVAGIHLDLVRAPEQLAAVAPHLSKFELISLGVLDGRNIWRNNYTDSLTLIDQATALFRHQQLVIAPSCSLLHVPYDQNLETNDSLPEAVRGWLAFAVQKLTELSELKSLALSANRASEPLLVANQAYVAQRSNSSLIENLAVQDRVQNLSATDLDRNQAFPVRKQLQQDNLQLPLLPTTTIGSFPQTKAIRQLRADYRHHRISQQEYQQQLENATLEAIRMQESIGLDVLVHGEFERNDMVEYFGQQLSGFAFTINGWVQSYGSRCVKPPIIYGDVSRPRPMTVGWSGFAQSLTNKPVKGMLTGPVTILQWSFVRDDQPRAATCQQLALAIRDEVLDLETANLQIIQVDEPALREGLPLKQTEWDSYLKWAVDAFRLATAGVSDATQIHTHMCYSEFNDIIEHIAALDADVITIECSRSQMELLDAFVEFKYPNDIGPGVYDIHAPRVPDEEEISMLLEKARKVIPVENLWVNPDCGLKTRGWAETKGALSHMVNAAKSKRKELEETIA
ncbi:5-methyltetrahydropteroyltriglutamate--homocysteine S-methyltransferase [Marinoscillum furvescens]|uniref:5-methyltetrahydropteroyltriglutamate--homocysteine methyltransferase n=1 Tax=Marinoscillum furvescens DSM 4134 TaxID=1122208 RepID=A0A3D9L0P0_MARFU|nr:5-methyltetrahydropteroyltriglutamate--homocysteine S-methyltransferase [Marinoscillum furvescens]RED97026.1 methionine synthase (B12-independent) [Marinoscillum furvescens DSM 4134]